MITNIKLDKVTHLLDILSLCSLFFLRWKARDTNYIDDPNLLNKQEKEEENTPYKDCLSKIKTKILNDLAVQNFIKEIYSLVDHISSSNKIQTSANRILKRNLIQIILSLCTLFCINETSSISQPVDVKPEPKIKEAQPAPKQDLIKNFPEQSKKNNQSSLNFDTLLISLKLNYQPDLMSLALEFDQQEVILSQINAICLRLPTFFSFSNKRTLFRYTYIVIFSYHCLETR